MSDAKTTLSPDVYKYKPVPPNGKKVLGYSGEIPVEEVRTHDTICRISPGEAAISSKFALCSAVIASKGDLIYVLHIFPTNQGMSDSVIRKLKESIVGKDTFDRVLIIGREANNQAPYFAEISKEPVQIIGIENKKKNDTFSVLVYNNPDSPGDVTSFDFWFDEKGWF